MATGKSKLPKTTNAKRNTKSGRAAMPSSDFAIPSQKAYRIDDPAHARDALSRVAANGTPAQQKTVQAAVKKKYPSIAVGGKTAKKKSK
jgi:hypothetical protein